MAGLICAGSNLKAHYYQQNVQKLKIEGPFENMSFSKKPFEDFNEKKNKKTSSLDQTTQWKTGPPRTTIKFGPCKQYN